MKTIYIHRHAKSDWNSGANSDHERPLNKRGKKNGLFMAEKFSLEHPTIDFLISSTATRAKRTMEFYQAALIVPENRTQLDRRIYGADVRAMMNVIERFPDENEIVMVFGHNPTFSELCNHLDNSFTDYLVTCARVRIELDIDSWEEVSVNCGVVKEHVYPKQFPEMRE